MTDAPSLQERFAESIGQLLGPDFPDTIGLAVSGGGDSMAMLALAHNWTRDWGVKLRVVTVDHGLRPEAADEAAMVAAECATLGWSHDTLKWTGWDRSGNLQDAARAARLRLIDDWRGTTRDVLFAHTADDQAETVLMRLARGSGVDGLSGMAAIRQVGDMRVVRPLLGERRKELRHYCRVLQVPWADDPTNEDRSYDRVRMRQLMGVLEAEGIGVQTLSDTAARLARAQVALKARAADVFSRIGSETLGTLRLDRDGFDAIERDTQLRILAAAIQWIGTQPYKPRADALDALLDRAMAGGGGTLGGVEITATKDALNLCRELNAVADMVCAPSQTWDARWHLIGQAPEDSQIAPLGQNGWQQIADKATATLPHRLALSLPALFDQGGNLLATAAFRPEEAEIRFELRAQQSFQDFLSH